MTVRGLIRTLKRRLIPAWPPRISRSWMRLVRRCSPNLPILPRDRSARETRSTRREKLTRILTDLFVTFAWFAVLCVGLRPLRKTALALVRPEAGRAGRGSQREI